MEDPMWRRIICLGLGAGGIAAAFFIVCVAGVALAPPSVTAVWGAVLGIPLTSLSRRLTWDGYLGGLVVWTSGSALLVALAGWLYYRLFLEVPRPLTPGRALAAANRRRV